MNLNTNTFRPVSPELLTQFGKTAAQTAETSGMSLTDAVVRSIGMTKLNEQQTRRVVEAANHEAYNRKFASMDASMRVVELDGGPADPSAVIDRLKAAAMPATVQGYSDYGMEPVAKSSSYSTAPETSKTAALTEVRVLHERLKAAHEDLAGQIGATKSYVHTAVQKVASLVRDAVAEGAYYEDFERAFGAISPKHATELLSVMQMPKAPEGVKTASRRISEGHPLLGAFQEFVKHAQSYEVACGAVRDVEAELIRVDSFLRGFQ